MLKRFVSLVVLLFLAAPLAGCRKTQASGSTAANIPTQGTYKVKRGDILNFVADSHKVHRATMLLANEAYLATEYESICSGLSAKKRDNPRRQGLFCNDRYRKPYGNTLVPGMVLRIPLVQAPAQITDVVKKSTGQKVALVIDESGSMGNDIGTVTSFYSAALYDQKKELIGIWLYSDGRVRKIDPQGFVNEYRPGGTVENTHQALKSAAADKPDTIILVTDEPGDDWNWPGWFGGMGLPPVVATCLPDRGGYACRDNLSKLASKTGGEYVAYNK